MTELEKFNFNLDLGTIQTSKYYDMISSSGNFEGELLSTDVKKDDFEKFKEALHRIQNYLCIADQVDLDDLNWFSHQIYKAYMVFSEIMSALYDYGWNYYKYFNNEKLLRDVIMIVNMDIFRNKVNGIDSIKKHVDEVIKDVREYVREDTKEELLRNLRDSLNDDTLDDVSKVDLDMIKWSSKIYRLNQKVVNLECDVGNMKVQRDQFKSKLEEVRTNYAKDLLNENDTVEKAIKDTETKFDKKMKDMEDMYDELYNKIADLNGENSILQYKLVSIRNWLGFFIGTSIAFAGYAMYLAFFATNQ